MRASTWSSLSLRHFQRGVAALEFALVGTVFIVILFGVASYGALFVVQQSLSRAAQEGARAYLQASIAPSQGSTPSAMACEAVAKSVEWLTLFRQGMGQPPIGCVSGIRACTYSSALTCGVVDVVYADYRTYPLIPEMVPLGAWLGALIGNGADWIPTNLTARGTVQIGAT